MNTPTFVIRDPLGTNEPTKTEFWEYGYPNEIKYVRAVFVRLSGDFDHYRDLGAELLAVIHANLGDAYAPANFSGPFAHDPR